MYLSEINGKLFIQDGEGLEIPVYAQLSQGLVAQSPKKNLRRCRGFSSSQSCTAKISSWLCCRGSCLTGKTPDLIGKPKSSP